jgi:hypothetical protein
MPPPLSADPSALDSAIESLSQESDRGAAVLAGSMVENWLGLLLRDHCARFVNKATSDELFGHSGPISTFSQRSLIAVAFGLISKRDFQELKRIRVIRNHFAHHPVGATFIDEKIRKDVEALRLFAFAVMNDELIRQGPGRMAYLVSCGALIGSFKGKLRESLQNPGPFRVARS